MGDMFFHLYSDGACRGNPGHGGAGAVLTDDKGMILASLKQYLGKCTNNVAEYKALILGLEEVQRRKGRRLAIHLDSELLVRQIQGTYRIKKDHLKPLMEKVRELLSHLDCYEVEHVYREQNHLADQLANEAIDEVLASEK
jgi:ribonuclease HI/probable phosphoglycerate mutase